MEPEIVYLIVCDDVVMVPANFHRLDIKGLLVRLWSSAGPLRFPLIQPEMNVMAIFLGGQGLRNISIRIVCDSTGQAVFQTRRRQIRFVGPADGISGSRFRIQRCSFPTVGLYWVECLDDNNVIGRQRLWVLNRGITP
jgi:hypothetical protein